MTSMTSKLRRFVVPTACCFLLACLPAAAGEFSIKPIRVELGSAIRSAVITVKNESQDKLSFQLQAMEWTQDKTGKDEYTDTRDLVYFPKIMTIDPGQEGVIRVGAKNAVVPTEKTYRLFIEELPGVAKAPTPQGGSAQINVLIRFGAPIFVTPLQPRDGLEIDSLSLANGVLTIAARNSGNRHQMVQGINLKGLDGKGEEIYALTLADRYLLAGTAKSYTTTIDSDRCSRINELAIEFRTDKLSVKRKLEVTRAMCR